MEGFKPTSDRGQACVFSSPAGCRRKWRSVNMRRPLRIEGDNVSEGSDDEDGRKEGGLTE